MEKHSGKSTKSFGKNTRVYGISATPTYHLPHVMKIYLVCSNLVRGREGIGSSLPPQLPSWAIISSQEGRLPYFSPLPPHRLQFQLANVKRTRLTLPHPAPIHRVGTLSSVWQVLNPGSIIFPFPAISSDAGSALEVASREEQRQPFPAPLQWCWSSAQGERQTIRMKSSTVAAEGTYFICNRWKNIYHTNNSRKTAEMVMLILDKADFKIKNISRDKQEYCMMTKGSIHEGDITVINIYSSNIW